MLDSEGLASFGEDGSTPVTVLGHIASYHVEVEGLEPASDIADAAVADLAMVDRANRGDLGPCSTQKQLVADVKLGAVDRALVNRYAEVLAQESHNGQASDAFEDVRGDRRSVGNTIAEHEEVFSRAFGYVALVIEHDRFVKAVEDCLGFGECGINI